MKRKIVTRRWYLRIGDNRGLILPLTLLVMVILSALALAILSIGGSEAQIASNHLRAVQAAFLAEAGLEHAFNTLQTTPGLMTGATAVLQNIVANPALGGAGTATGGYTVQYQAAGPNTVRVVSTGASAIGGSQAIRRAVMSTSFSAREAILTNGPLGIGGSAGIQDPVFAGQCASVHTNNALTLSGNASVAGAATAAGSYTAGGSTTVGPGSGGSRPAEYIPAINPTDFLNTAQASLDASRIFQMMANGKVLNGNGTTELADLASGGSYCGWHYTAGTPLAEWKFTGNAFCNGTYYLDGHAKVQSSPGDPGTPWKTTLIATGDLIVSGSPVIGADAAYTVRDTLFVAGLDVKLTGTPSNGWNGLIAAHEQFHVSGNTSVKGFIIGEDASATSNTVTSNTVTGNLTLTFSCGLNPPLFGPLQILSWGL
jgi:Tfp pilus assembly protein PilX